MQRAYEQQMYGYQRYGIIRRNGFLYLDNGKEVQFRGPGDIERDIKQIAPEELAAGMLEILKQNVTADKAGLYRSLASAGQIDSAIGEFRRTLRKNIALNDAFPPFIDVLKQTGDPISLAATTAETAATEATTASAKTTTTVHATRHTWHADLTATHEVEAVDEVNHEIAVDVVGVGIAA